MNEKRLSGLCTLLLASLLIVMLAGCRREEHTAQPQRSVYCWQTTFAPNDSTVAAFIRHQRITHIYLRYFDVVMTQGTPMPNASVNVVGRVPKGVTVTPVVYITNDCMKAIGQNHTEATDLAKKLFRRVRQMTSTLQLGAVSELQIDCDWTVTTRRTYFDFLSVLRDLAYEQHLQLSTTIRFYQLTQPVPPADRGVLMAYNTGDVRDNLATYRLPLSTAYPIFSWRVLFRGGHFVGILHSDDDYPILPGDKIVRRAADARHILEAHQTISELRPDAHDEIILYDLQTNNIKNLQVSDYEKIYHR